jgi:hypothetical protein
MVQTARLLGGGSCARVSASRTECEAHRQTNKTLKGVAALSETNKTLKGTATETAGGAGHAVMLLRPLQLGRAVMFEIP